MPYMTNPEFCRSCRESNKKTRLKWHSRNNKYYLQTSCVDCERYKHKKYQETHREAVRSTNRQYYLKKVGSLSRRSPIEMTDELRIQYHRDKSMLRCTRAKNARVEWDKELTEFAYKEAHILRRIRDKMFKFRWHVDHIIPLKGKYVSGLHVWNNFAVIPSVDNLRKGNYYSVHD